MPHPRQAAKWFDAFLDTDPGRAYFVMELLAEWRRGSPKDLDARAYFAKAICGMLDELPGPIIDETEQLSVLAVAVESLFGAFARVTGKANVWCMPAGGPELH